MNGWRGLRVLFGAGVFMPLLLMVACSDDTTTPTNPEVLPDDEFLCSIPQNLIWGGGAGKDGIPALTNPSFVLAGDPRMGYLKVTDRVVGLVEELLKR